MRACMFLSGFCDKSIGMFVTGSTTAEEREGFRPGIPKFMLFARRNSNCVTLFHLGDFRFNAHFAAARSDEVNLLRFGVVMLLGAGANGQTCLGEALVANS